MPGFESLGACVVGVSGDRLPSLKRFTERDGLPFPLLSDRTGSVLRAYGARGLFGFAKRRSFLIDPAGIVRRVYTKVSPRGHAADVLRDLESLSESELRPA